MGTASILKFNPLTPGQTGVDPVTGPGMAGVPGFTVTLIVLLVAVVGDTHVAFEVRTTVTRSPLFNVVDVKVELLVPTLFPFTFH